VYVAASGTNNPQNLRFNSDGSDLEESNDVGQEEAV
jgi:hypothetical protein